MIREVEGVILSCVNYSESSKILKIITKEYGVISVIAKGARRMKSKFSLFTSNLTYAKFNIYYKPLKISVLISVDVIDNLKTIKKNINLISYASYITELTGQVLKCESNLIIYNDYISALKKINDNFNPKIIVNILEVKYLEFLGIKPILDRCIMCSSKENLITISSYKGGAICSDCYTSEKIVNEKTMKLINMFLYVDISGISNIKIDDKIVLEIDNFLTDYYDRYSGLYLYSKKFLKNLEKINN